MTASAPSLRLLGPPEARLDEARLPLGPPLQQAMLVMLALARGASAGTAELIDGIWGQDSPATAAQALRNYANRLRNLLEPGRGARVPSRLLQTAGDGYRLVLDPAHVDVIEFEDLVAPEPRRREHDAASARARLDRALRLWRGKPLAGVPGPYAERQRARLADLRADALERRSALDIELGDHTAAIDGLSELVAERLLWERPRVLLMRALHATGRTADALDLYTRTRDLLAEELGTDPGPEIVRTHLEILRTPDEAVSMLTRLCGRPATTRDPRAARRLVAACGHLPLAIRVAAARLRSRPAWQVRDLADRLAAGHRRLDWLSLGDVGVTATLESSHAHLTAAQARALRLLAVPDAADFGLPAAALLDLPECEAEELCESLTDAALLESGRAGRYRHHDLVRLFARAKLAERPDGADERAAALARLVDHQLAVTTEACRLLASGTTLPARLPARRSLPVPFDSPAAARAWLAAERPGLFAVIRQAASEPAVRLLSLLTDAAHLPVSYTKEAAEVARRMLGEGLDERTEGRVRALLGGLVADGAPSNTWPLAPTMAGPRTADAT